MNLPPDWNWMMMQAWRYMAGYQKLSQKHLSFIERSENTDWSDRGNLFAALERSGHMISSETTSYWSWETSVRWRLSQDWDKRTCGNTYIKFKKLKENICFRVRVVKSAGLLGRILNLEYIVLVGMPEESVAPFFETSISLDFLNTFP